MIYGLYFLCKERLLFNIRNNNIRKMKITSSFIFLVICLSSLFAHGQNFQNTMSLDGSWEIIFDDRNEGVEGQWHLNKNYDAHSDIHQIDVPSCWEEYEKNYEGVAFYRKSFTVPQNWSDKIITLNFDASNYMTQVWLNEEVVGFHEGGYTPFSFRIDKLAKPGEDNIVTVRVISPIILTDKRIDGLGRQEVPMWRGAITGGIWQSVSLEVSGKTRITDVFLEPDIHDNTVTFNLEIENSETIKKTSEVQIRILSDQGKEVVILEKQIEVLPGKKNIRYELAIEEAKYWSVDSPYLYQAEVNLKENGDTSDQWSSKFGMREFTAKDNQFVLNGKPIYLKASFFEGLYPVKLAYPDSREMAIKEIQLAKEAGFNMIRPWRKPAPPMWFDLCDSLGMLTVGSLAVECMHRPISTPRLSHVVENEVRQTILANRNRTCIVQWELFNEINRPILAQMLNSMSILARELDPTRMILDESGGWGLGANVYLPYERTPITFNDIHHYSGSQVHEKEYNGYLAIAKTNDEMKALGLGGAKGYGKNVVKGAMSYVSELGYGSTPDLTINNQRFASEGNPIVAPTIYHKKMEDELKYALKQSGFDKIYPDLQDFYLEQQKMHGIANKRIIEAVRSNTSIAGYCVHALVGGDWVIGAGLLDLWRNPKTLAYDMTKEANQEQIAAIRLLPRNIYAGQGAMLEIKGINELETEAATVSITIKAIKGKAVFKKTVEKDLEHGISTLFTDELNTSELKGNYTVEVNIKAKDGKLITSNSQQFDVFTAKQLEAPQIKFAVVDPSNTLQAFFQKRNIDFVPFDDSIDKNTLVLVGKANQKNESYMAQAQAVTEFVKQGGHAIFLEVPGKRTNRFHIGGDLKEIESNTLPFGAEMNTPWEALGGWASKSHIVTDHPVFDGLPTNMIMHGVYENVHPKTSMAKQKGKYIAGLIGYDHFPSHNIMLRHYNGPGETWWSADVLETEIGEGKLLLSTLDLIKHLGSDPVAEKILFNMIRFASENE